jgi:hypothetical protein
MKKVTAMYGAVFSVLLMAFFTACGSVSEEGGNSSAEVLATKTQIELAKTSPTSIVVGEKKTATIAIDSQGTFQGFQLALGYDPDKVKIEKISLAMTDNPFTGPYVFNLEPDSNNLIFPFHEVVIKNAAKGLSTAIVAGMSLSSFNGRVALVNVEFTGVNLGETIVTPELYGVSPLVKYDTVNNTGTIVVLPVPEIQPLKFIIIQ